MTTLPGVELETEQITVLFVAAIPGFLATEIDHAAVVTREYDQCVICGPGFPEALHYFADDPVELVDEVTVYAALARPLELLGGGKRVMDVGR